MVDTGNVVWQYAAMTDFSLLDAVRWVLDTSKSLPAGPLKTWFVPRATARMFQTDPEYEIENTGRDGYIIKDFIEGLLWEEDFKSIYYVIEILVKMGSPACIALQRRLAPCVQDLHTHCTRLPGSIRARKACRDVADWLASLPESRPRLATSSARMERMTFAQAEVASREWHRQLSVTASKRKQREREKAAAIPDGPDDISEALCLDTEHRWVWLLTQAARQREGKVMGHCVGGASYSGVRVLSLRDKRGMSIATAALSSRGGVSQATGPDNSSLKAQGQAALECLQRWLSERSEKPAQEATAPMMFET